MWQRKKTLQTSGRTSRQASILTLSCLAMSFYSKYNVFNKCLIKVSHQKSTKEKKRKEKEKKRRKEGREGGKERNYRG